jgi:DNA helicase-2/ATP-dependent DNA helicase PcrA
MTTIPVVTGENTTDDVVEEQIRSCVNLDDLKSFFLYAAAGSGKTRSLVNALQWIRDTYGRHLWLQGQRIGVITYTNAACDEIKERMEFNILIEVSTIHSFAWNLIGSFQTDVRNWLRTNLATEIAELQQAQAKGRPGTKAAAEREAAIKAKRERLEHIETVKAFQYSPIGENRGRDALNHSEVISMTVAFLTTKPTLQHIVVHRYPILLVDESQDTNRFVMDALLTLQAQYKTAFCLGLFGDMMQRIYADGKVGLEAAIPPDWARPKKQMNHRCPGRVLELLNCMRAEVDGQVQKGRTDKPPGFARLFLLPANIKDKPSAEVAIANQMAAVTGDELWKSDYKALILEHHMAAKRLGFSPMFESLSKVDRIRTGLLDGTLPGISLFAKQVLPLVDAMRSGDHFRAAMVVKRFSPILDSANLKMEDQQLDRLAKAKAATDSLLSLWEGGNNPSFGDVLQSIHSSGLFEIPETLRVLVSRPSTASSNDTPDAESERDEILKAWEGMLATPFEQIAAYDRYVSGTSPFDTHQGVKGREFPRVMVVIDDEDARGFMFSYEKLFGVKDKSATDRKNEQEGAETIIDRTRRLLYVTCSRAKDSLAIVNYTADPAKAKENVLAARWLHEGEVIVPT